MKQPVWSNWDEVIEMKLLVWIDWVEVTGRKWLMLWSDSCMKWVKVWSDSWYEITLIMKWLRCEVNMVWSVLIPLFLQLIHEFSENLLPNWHDENRENHKMWSYSHILYPFAVIRTEWVNSRGEQNQPQTDFYDCFTTGSIIKIMSVVTTIHTQEVSEGESVIFISSGWSPFITIEYRMTIVI